MAAAFSPAGMSLQQRASSIAAPKVWSQDGLRTVALPSRKAPKAAAARPQGSATSRRSLVVKAVVPKGLVDVNEIDNQKFSSLALRRVVFGHDDWKKHKSSGRYFRHIKTIATSKVVGALGPPVTVMAGIASAVVGWNNMVMSGVLPEWTPILHVATLPFSLTAPALSFLLVFRTNASYGRFDEARKMWGLMLNRTRDICRQSLTYMARDQFTYEYPKRAQFLRHIQAFPLCYKHHFLQEGSLEEDLRNFTSLTEEEIQGLLESTHRPNACLQMASECMGRCHMEPVYRLAMEQNFATFADDVGGSERLFKTPIPLSYTRLTSRFLVLYHLFLPFALWDSLNWLTIPVTIIHTAIFFCIEEVGVLIENPFPVLALDVIAQSARNNVAELIALHDGIRELVVPDDNEFKQLSAASQQAMLPKEPAFVPEPEPEYESEWEEDAAGLPNVEVAVPVPAASQGVYSDF